MRDTDRHFLCAFYQVKRQAFPRFYFLADEELLDLLSRCRNTSAIQPHLQKCFDAVHSLDFGGGPGSNTINAMVRGRNKPDSPTVVFSATRNSHEVVVILQGQFYLLESVRVSFTIPFLSDIHQSTPCMPCVVCDLAAWVRENASQQDR